MNPYRIGLAKDLGVEAVVDPTGDLGQHSRNQIEGKRGTGLPYGRQREWTRIWEKDPADSSRLLPLSAYA